MKQELKAGQIWRVKPNCFHTWYWHLVFVISTAPNKFLILRVSDGYNQHPRIYEGDRNFESRYSEMFDLITEETNE